MPHNPVGRLPHQPGCHQDAHQSHRPAAQRGSRSNAPRDRPWAHSGKYCTLHTVPFESCFFKEINTFIHQGCIKLILKKVTVKTFTNVTDFLGLLCVFSSVAF